MNAYSLSSAAEQPDRTFFEEPQIGQALEGLTDGFSTFDEHWRFTFVSPKCKHLFALTADVLGRNLWEDFPLLVETKFYAAAQRALTERKTVVCEELCPYTHLWVESRIQPCRNGVAIYYQDISARIQARDKRAEAALREQAALLDQAPDAIVVCDLKRAIKFWYKGAERIYGWTAEEAHGKIFCELLRPEESSGKLEELSAEFFKAGEWRGELRFRTKAGRELINDCHWTLVRDDDGRDQAILIIHTDITEKKKLEEQFLRAQRMESIGTLAGGIAHDLNNVLSPILLATRILHLKFTDEDSQKILDTLRRSAQRGADLVRQVLTYARGTDGERVLLQPRHLIHEVVRMLQDTLPKSIAVKQQLPAQLWAINGDTTQLYQVVMNLCVNARDAMSEGGVLSISAENTSLDAGVVKSNLDASPGDFVVINVADTGLGIPCEIRSKIFEPFFTTKIAGQGSGLGLATVLGIVKSHHGFIDFESEVGRGTSFKIYLPAVKNKVVPELEREAKELPRGQGETILIVDDEVEILQMTSETLAAYGYQTLMANGGDDALQQCRQSPTPIALALVDMMMPRLDGLATIRELKQLSPALKIITTSGLADSRKLAEATALGASAFLAKPCPPGKMIQTIASVLRSKS